MESFGLEPLNHLNAYINGRDEEMNIHEISEDECTLNCCSSNNSIADSADSQKNDLSTSEAEIGMINIYINIIYNNNRLLRRSRKNHGSCFQI